jgi:hypothetical protein
MQKISWYLLIKLVFSFFKNRRIKVPWFYTHRQKICPLNTHHFEVLKITKKWRDPFSILASSSKSLKNVPFREIEGSFKKNNFDLLDIVKIKFGLYSTFL